MSFSKGNKGQRDKDRDGYSGRTNSQWSRNTEVQQSGAAATGRGNGQQSRGGSNHGPKRGAGNERSKDYQPEDYVDEELPAHMKPTKASQSKMVKIDVKSTKVLLSSAYCMSICMNVCWASGLYVWYVVITQSCVQEYV